MKLNHAKVIVNEPRYLEAQKVIAEAEVAGAIESGKVPPQDVDEPVIADEAVEDQESNLQERID